MHKTPLTFGYAVFPRHIACFWSLDRSHSNTKRTGLSIYITGGEIQAVVYQPIEKKQVFIAGLQPDRGYTLAVDIVTIDSPGFKGFQEESIANFVEATPRVSVSE